MAQCVRAGSEYKRLAAEADAPPTESVLPRCLLSPMEQRCAMFPPAVTALPHTALMEPR